MPFVTRWIDKAGFQALPTATYGAVPRLPWRGFFPIGGSSRLSENLVPNLRYDCSRLLAASVIRMDADISDAWRRAAQELGIRVVAPYDVSLVGGRAARVEAYVQDFGSVRGAIVLSQRTGNLAAEMNRNGHWHSILTESHRAWDRKRFIDTLNDWGWFGPEGQEPDWYTGPPWS